MKHHKVVKKCRKKNQTTSRSKLIFMQIFIFTNTIKKIKIHFIY